MGNYAGLFITGGDDDNRNAGYSVDSIGDINGDGIDDIAISSPSANIYNSENENIAFNRGKVYIVFGQENGVFDVSVDLEALDGTDGFALTPQLDLTDNQYGVSLYQAGGARFGHDVKGLGDVNGDGVDDFGIVQRATDSSGYFNSDFGGPNGGTNGVAYVIYGGQQPWEAEENIQDVAGFRIDAQGYADSLVALGDVNGDGIVDIGLNTVDRYSGGFIYANYSRLYDADGNGVYDPGTNDTLNEGTVPIQLGEAKSFVIYGTDEARVSQDPIADPENQGGGFNGPQFAVSTEPNTSEVIVNTDLLDGSDGFTIVTGVTAQGGYYGEFNFNYYFGGSTTPRGIESMGDFNGDGFADIMAEESGYFVEDLNIVVGVDYSTYTRDGGYISDSTTGNYLIFGQDGGPTSNELDITNFTVPDGVDFRVSRFATFDDSRANLGDVSGDGNSEIGFRAFISAETNPIDGVDENLNAIVVMNGTTDDPFSQFGDGSTPTSREFVAQDVVDGLGAIYFDDQSFFNSAVRGVGDVNGDGTDDFAIVGNDMMYLVFGQETAVSGLFNLSDMVDAGDAYRFLPEFAGEIRNVDVSAAGDLNDGGLDDILIGTGNFNRIIIDGGVDQVAEAAGLENTTGYVIFGEGLEAADAVDGVVDNVINIGNLNVDIITGERATELGFNPFGTSNRFLNEGDTGSTIFTFEVVRTGDLSETVSFDYEVVGSGFSPANADDFVGGAFPSDTVTFADGEDTALVEIAVQGDTTIENTDRFQVNITGATTSGPLDVLLNSDTSFATILNDDFPAFIRITSPTTTEDGQLEFIVTRTGDLSSEVSVDYTASANSFRPVTAEDIADVNGQGPGLGQTGTITFLPTETSKTITVDPVDDDVIEGQEIIRIDLSNAVANSGDVTLSSSVGLGRINDNDFLPEIFAQGGIFLSEGSTPGGSTPVTLEIVRRGDTDGVTEVTYDLNPLPAPGNFFAADSNDIDGFLPSFGNVVRFEDGETVKQITVNINHDGIIEPREQFELRITEVESFNGTTYNVIRPNTTVTIANDDGRPPVIPTGVEADVFGDPHIVTLDGLGYDFQAVGEYVLVESTIADDPRDLDVQVRFEPLPGSDLVSVTTRMAVNIGEDIVEVDALGDNALLINSVPVSAEDLALGALDASGGDFPDVFFDAALSEFTIVLNDLNEQLQIKNMDGVLNICVFLSSEDGGHANNVMGLMGNANGDTSDDLMTRDGTTTYTEPTFDELYVDYADSWKITEEERNFTDALDAGTFPDNFPAAKIAVEDLPDAILAAAEEAVDQAGITDPILREAAILDFALTGDDNFITGALGLAAVPEEEIEVTDAPEMPLSIGVSPAVTTVNEGDGNPNTLSFAFFRIGDDTNPIVIDYAIGGDVDASDLAPDTDMTGQITIPAGADTATLSIDVLNDTLTEDDEALTVSITGNDQGALIASSSGTTTIETDDFAPVAVDDSFGTSEDDAVSGSLLDPNPTDADEDANGDELSVIAVNGVAVSDGETVELPSGAELLINSDGTFTYDPSGAFDVLASGDDDTDSFTYTISDGNGGEDTATATINISGANDAPIAGDDAVTTDEDDEVVIDLAALVSDIDTASGDLTITPDDPSDGELADNGDGTWTYTPDEDYNGDDSFTYTVSDGELSDTGEVSITVDPVNDAPVAGDDSYATAYQTAIVLTVLDNDSDVDGDPVTIAGLIGNPAGDVQITDGGTTLTYTPQEGFSGEDTFGYLLSDGSVVADAANVVVTVAGPGNRPPEPVDDEDTTNEDNSVTFYVLANDDDPDGDLLDLVSFTDGEFGSVEDDGEGGLVYTPDANFFGEDSFTYIVSDGEFQREATVTVNVDPVNDAPVPAQADEPVLVSEDDMPVTLNLLEGATDVEGDTLTLTAATASWSGGALGISFDSDGEATFNPGQLGAVLDAADEALVTVGYTISDGDISADGIAKILVSGADDEPSDLNLILGSNDRDTLDGTEAADDIRGFAGNDRINGNDGEDVINAGAGRDWNVRGGNDADIFEFGIGDERVRILDFEDGLDMIRFTGGLTLEDLTVSTSSTGRSVNIFAGTSADRLTIRVDEGETIDENDFMFSGEPVPNPGELIEGTRDGDRLFGTTGDDTIFGFEGSDKIDAGSGDDIINAGSGNDWSVRGGLGADIFEFGMGDERTRILDFQDGTDMIQITGGLTFGDLSINANNNVFIGSDRLIVRSEEEVVLTEEDFLFV